MNYENMSDEELIRLASAPTQAAPAATAADPTMANLSDDELIKMASGGAPAAETPQTGILETLAMKGAKGSTFGLYDEVEGVLGGIERGAKNLLGTSVGDKGFLDAVRTGYNTDKNAARAYQAQMSKDNPVASVVGELLPAVPTLAARGGLSLAKMAGQGALSGYGNSEANNIDEQLVDTAQGGVLGAALGKAGELVGKGASKLGGSIKEGIQKLKTDNSLKSLGAQKPQLRRMGGDYGEDVAQYALDKGLVDPLKSTATKQALAQSLKKETGKELSASRDKLPPVAADKAFEDIMKSFEGVNLQDSTQRGASRTLKGIESDLKRRATIAGPDMDVGPTLPTNMTAKDFIDYKSSLFKSARNPQGMIVDDTLEQARRGLGKTELELADSIGESGLKDLIKRYSMDSQVGELLSNKAAQSGNSLLGMGGLITGAGGAGTAIATGNPEYAALGLLGAPAVRSKIGEVVAKGINKGQGVSKALGGLGAEALGSPAAQKVLNTPMIKKLVEMGKLDPKIAAYLISRQQE